MSSIQEVAREAGVSTATVSRTFSTPDLLTHSTRQRVLDVAQRLNYRPRVSHARRTSGRDGQGSSNETLDTLGFLFFASEFDVSPINEFYAPVLSGAQAEAAHRGMHLLIRMAPRYTQPHEVPKMFREQAVAGTLLVGAALPDVLDAYAEHLPVSVLVDNCDTKGRHDCILSDGFDGVRCATDYLIGLGHRRIGFVLDEVTAPSFRDRRRGWLCAQWEAELPIGPYWVLPAARGDDFKESLTTLLMSPDRPTALIAANDALALAVMQVCRSIGLNIPDDLSIIGFDDIPFSVHTYPPLTTVRVDKELMGRLAVRSLLSRINEGQTSATGATEPVHISVPVFLVVRESCGPPKSKEPRTVTTS